MQKRTLTLYELKLAQEHEKQRYVFVFCKDDIRDSKNKTNMYINHPLECMEERQPKQF